MQRYQQGQNREKADFPPNSYELLGQMKLFHDVTPKEYCQHFSFLGQKFWIRSFIYLFLKTDPPINFHNNCVLCTHLLVSYFCQFEYLDIKITSVLLEEIFRTQILSLISCSAEHDVPFSRPWPRRCWQRLRTPSSAV